jgi:integrase
LASRLWANQSACCSVEVLIHQRLRMVHLRIQHAIDLDWRRHDPTEGVRNIKNKAEGFATWDDLQIERFPEQHKPGPAHISPLACCSIPGSGKAARCGLGRQHVRDGLLTIVQQKTGWEVPVPVHPVLAAAIDAVPRDNPAFLTTAQGRPFTPLGFTNWFRGMVRDVKGMPNGLSPHGLRKAICRRLAEAGCTPHEIMAISGPKSLQEVTRYTAKASRVRMAQTALKSIIGSKLEQATVKPAPKV